MAPERFLVTGCAGGIGQALADALVARGARLLATDVRDAPLREHAAAAAWPAGRARVAALDVTDADAWERALDEAGAAFGGVDVLFNVAGYLRPGHVHEAPAQEVARHLDVNARGVILGTIAAARRMVRDGGGHVVNIASMAALAPIPGLALYSASKYAVRGFSLAAAFELRPHGVHVTVVCPDAVATPMLELQKRHAEAALTFSGPRILAAAEVVALLLGPVLADRPLEIALPARRKWLARVADLFPGLGLRFAPGLRRKGLARQRRLASGP